VYVNIVPGFWDAFTVFLGHPELALDARFGSNEARQEHRDVLHVMIQEAMATLDRAEAERRAAECRIPVGAVRTFEEILSDPHLEDRGFWETVTTAGGDGLRQPGSAFHVHAGSSAGGAAGDA